MLKRAAGQATRKLRCILLQYDNEEVKHVRAEMFCCCFANATDVFLLLMGKSLWCSSSKLLSRTGRIDAARLMPD